MSQLSAQQMIHGFKRLDQLIERPLTLIMGGGGAMLLAYKFPLSTSDIDAVPKYGIHADRKTEKK